MTGNPARQWLQFIGGGALNTGFTYGLYFLLQMFLNYQVAYGIAYAAGILFSYWFNSVVVFRTELNTGTLVRYPLVYLVQYAAGALLLGTLVEVVGISSRFAPLLVTVLMIPATFVMSRWIILRGKK